MKVLVTGTRGQLARALAERTRHASPNVLVFAGRPELDLEQPSTIFASLEALRPDVVISAAAFTDVEGAEIDPERAFRVNAGGTSALAAATRDINGRLIHISTDFVFDGAKGAPYDEDDAPNPLNVYATSKLAGEAEVRGSLAPHVIVRTSWVYSPFGKNFVTTMLSLAKSRSQLSVVDDQSGNPTSAFDLADAILSILQRWESDPAAGLGETFHVAGAGVTTWRRFAEAIFEASGNCRGPTAQVAPISTVDWPAKARRPVNSALDCAKFDRVFQWTAPDWRTSLPPIVAGLVREQQEVQHCGH